MADFPYTPKVASVKRFLDHIQSAGIPDKVTQKYLEKVGFTSKNDRYILGVLKFIGFVDTAGIPTKMWQAYRNRKLAGATLAEVIRRSYSDLFKTYPDAHRKDSEALRNYFSAHTKVAESTLSLIVQTFKTLSSLADFDEELGADVPSGELSVSDNDEARPPQAKQRAAPQRDTFCTSPVVNINIQLQLPATDDAGVYDKLFAALKKHLFSQSK